MRSDRQDLARMRREYGAHPDQANPASDNADVVADGDATHGARDAGGDTADDAWQPGPVDGSGWLRMFRHWLDEAVRAGLTEPNAMVLATADQAGQPSARSVLLKDFDERGFTFFTNHTSRKGRDLAANPYASLVFPWYPLHRQIVVTGRVARVDRAETEEYFAVRPREAQLGAWASPQSTVIASRAVLDRAWREAADRFPGPVPAPPHWGGYRVTPLTIEFWTGRPNRLHDRRRYRCADDGTWILERLAP